MKQSLTIAIVGRVNAGKSTFFNRVIGKKKAIVSETPRVTRDRNIADVEHFSRPFTLIDTGGFEKQKNDVISSMIEDQIKSAIQASNVVLFLVDGKAGVTPLDKEILGDIRKLREDFEENVYIVVNKIDDPDTH